MNGFKLCSNSEEYTLYRQMDETFRKVFIFNKRLKQVNVCCAYFVLKNDIDKDVWKKITNDERNKYSCKYGFWQGETLVSLSVKEIEFIWKTSKRLFGQQEEK